MINLNTYSDGEHDSEFQEKDIKSSQALTFVRAF